MGQNYSQFDEKSIKTFVANIMNTEKAQRLKRRDFLVVGDILNIEMPEEYSLNFEHLGLLYCLDTSKDGRYYLEDLEEFGVEIIEQIEKLKDNKQGH